MKRLKRWVCFMLTAAMLLGMNVMESQASSVISSVSLKVRIRVDSNVYTDDISIDTSSDLLSGDTGCSVTSTSSKYVVSSAYFVDSKTLHVGDTPKIKVYLTTTDGSDHYFKGTYSSSNVHITGGSYVSAKRNSEDELVVTLRAGAVKGTYESPDDAYWSNVSSQLGRAKWSSVSNSSNAYDVYLYRNGSIVHKVEKLKATTYNFYPYMTKEGTYSFRVRTVPYSDTQESAGKKSDWTESDEEYISADYVSDGSGQTSSNSGSTGSADGAGWVKDGSYWYFRYPNGDYIRNAWYKVNDKWYYFNTSGQMMTGWQTINGNTYYLMSSGEMYEGWMESNNRWYYLNANKDATEGALCKNNFIQFDNHVYYVDPSGEMVTGWCEINGNMYYFYADGTRAANTYIDTFYVDANGMWVH